MLTSPNFEMIYSQTKQAIAELQQIAQLNESHILVVGASSSEVLGERIGTSGSDQIAQEIVKAFLDSRDAYSFHVAFQCCEHLNRAIVCEKATADRFHLEEVSVIPMPRAGGAVAAQAYKSFTNSIVVEHIQAHAGIDI